MTVVVRIPSRMMRNKQQQHPEQRDFCPGTSFFQEDTDMTNKEVVQAMYDEFFNGHDVNAALKYVKEDYIQHNPGPGQGRANLMKAFGEKFISNPTFHLDIQRMIAEDDMVAVYLKAKGPQGETVCQVVDLYRLEDGKLAEHWDVLQPVER